MQYGERKVAHATGVLLRCMRERTREGTVHINMVLGLMHGTGNLKQGV